MKKILFGLLSFILIAVGGNLLSTNFSHAKAENTVVEIGSVSQFIQKFSDPSIYNDENVKIILKQSLNFNGTTISCFANRDNVFMGTFDGNGYSISNVMFDSNTLYYGLIPYAKNATIENVRINGYARFNFDSANIQEVCAGALVGYGENIVVRNCEFDNVMDGSTTENTIDLPVYSNLNFGVIAGKIKGNPNANNYESPANIIDCVSYYDLDVELNKYSNVMVGGLVGCLDNAYILNSMNFGDIEYSKSQSLGATNSNIQYFGGLAGTITGSGLNIRNACFAGTIDSYEDVSGVNSKVGAIFGGAISTQPKAININFDYYTQVTLSPSGDNYVEKGSKLAVVSAITRAFLLDASGEKFDQTVKGYDFKKTWSYEGTKFHIQNFRTFQYSFNNILDNAQIIDSAKFSMTKEGDDGSIFLSARYGSVIYIKIKLKAQYQGFYTFSNILLDNSQFNGEYKIEEVSSKGKLEGYIIEINANATTTGSYSFVISQKTYDCLISISEEAKLGNQGGVRVINKGETTPSQEFHMTFAYNTERQQIIAEGEDIFSFDHWELYYREADGSFSQTATTFGQENNNVVLIQFGSAPFDREFKLVAFFTDAEAINLGFGTIDNNLIKAIKMGAVEYAQEPFKVAPTRVAQIEIVTQKGYILNEEALSQKILNLYGYNISPYPPVKKNFVNENGETSYTIAIDFNYAKVNIKNNELTLKLEVVKDMTSNKNNSLWVYLAIGGVAVVILGVIIFFIIRHRNGGGRRGRGRSQARAKKQSYKDYYY